MLEGELRRLLLLSLGLVGAALLTAASCQPPPTPEPEPEPAIFAVAYSNLDGSECYDPAGTDVLISKLVDTNDDGLVSVGDTVVTDQYPLDSDASNFGSFQDTTHLVTTTMFAAPAGVRVGMGPNGETEWVVQPEIVQWDETDDTTLGATILVDGHLAGQGNAIQAHPLFPSPSAPDTYVAFSDLGADNDESFLEIDIFI